MAEVTVNRKRTNVIGNRRQVLANVDVASNGDTLTLTGTMHIIESVQALNDTNAALGATVAAGVITFVTGGALTNVHVDAIGQ